MNRCLQTDVYRIVNLRTDVFPPYSYGFLWVELMLEGAFSTLLWLRHDKTCSHYQWKSLYLNLQTKLQKIWVCDIIPLHPAIYASAQVSSRIRIFVYSSDSTVCRLPSSLSIQYLLFCSSFVLLYDEVKHQLRFNYIPLIFRHCYTFGTKEKFKNNLRLKTRKFKNIKAHQKVKNPHAKCLCMQIVSLNGKW